MKFPFRKKKPIRETAYHDHTEPRWGWACYVQPVERDGTRRACIFGKRPKDGDVVLMRSATMQPETGEHGVLQYLVVGDPYTPMDPGDQHFCLLRFMEAETNAAEGKDPRSAFQRSWDLHGDLP